MKALSVDIGSRPSCSEAEQEAAGYIRRQLASYGYEAELQPFTFDVFSDAGTAMRVLSPQAREVQAYPLEPSANGTVEGSLVAAGLGRPQEFPAGTKGKIALIKRGDITFSEKLANAAAAGAKAAPAFPSASLRPIDGAGRWESLCWRLRRSAVCPGRAVSRC